MNKVKNKIVHSSKAYFSIFGGLIVFVVGMLGYRQGYLNKVITERNERVVVKVIDCYEFRDVYFFKFEYKNDIIIKTTRLEYCKFLKGVDEVEMLINEDHDHFLFIDEFETENTPFAGLLFSGFGFGVMYKGFKVLRPNQNQLWNTIEK